MVMVSANVVEQSLATAEEQSHGEPGGIYQVKITNPVGKLAAIFNGVSFEIGGAIVE